MSYPSDPHVECNAEIAALHAEVERLKRERDEARAEATKWTQEFNGVRQLERLREAVRVLLADWQDGVASPLIDQEVEELRVALDAAGRG